MDNITAEMIGRKAKALKHCNKVLSTIDKKGSATISLNCTGVVFTFCKNDAIYLQLQTTRAQLAQEIGSYEIIRRVEENKRVKVAPPAPFGAAE